MKKIILLLMGCTLSILELSAAWNIEGAEYVYPYRPYQYFIGNATGLTKAVETYTCTVVNGKIMDKYGNYTLTSLNATNEELTDIRIMWDFSNSGQLKLTRNNGTFLTSKTVNIGSGYLTITGSYSWNVSFDRANITIQNASFLNGSNADINGYKSVTINSGFRAELGSKVKIYSKIPDLVPARGQNMLATRSVTDTGILLSEEFEPEIGQNTPNPFNDYTKVKYCIARECGPAYIQVCDMTGRSVKKVILTEKGNNWIFLDRADLPEGIYLYSLVVDNLLVDTKRMVVE